MALVPTITKIRPKIDGKQITIGVLAVLKEEGVEVLRKIFTTNTEKTGDPELKAAEIVAPMNEWIKQYQDETAAYEHAKMNTFVTAVEQGVVI